MFFRGILLLAIAGAASVLGLDQFWYPLRQVQEINCLSAEQFSQAIQDGKTVVVHFTVPTTDDPEAQEMDKINEQMLQMAAQSLNKRNVTFGRINMVENQDLAEQAGVTEADTIMVFTKGRKHVYRGHRSAEPLIAFVNRVEGPIVNVIENKLQKKAFDRTQTSKVIGFFQAWPTSEEMLAFEAAAMAHYPCIPFMAVITHELATCMKFTQHGEIHVVRPYEKIHSVLPQNPATEADISAFLEGEGRPIMRQVILEDLHSVWSNADEARIVAFARVNSPDGKALSKAFRNMAKYGLLRNATDRTILLIDPDNFPVLVDHWQTLFNFDLTMPALGLLNVTDNAASWADLRDFSAMNRTDQIALVTLWLEAVSSGKIRVDGITPVPTLAELEAITREAEDMAMKAMEAAKRAEEAAKAVSEATDANAPQEQPASETEPQEQQPASETKPQEQPASETEPQEQQPASETEPQEQQPASETEPQEQPASETEPQEQQPASEMEEKTEEKSEEPTAIEEDEGTAAREDL